MKKKLLFVCVSFGLGGSERCMTEMLRSIDPERYEITLQSLIPVENRNVFPDWVRAINGYPGFEEYDAPMRQFVPQALKKGKLGLLFRKCAYWLMLTLGKEEYAAAMWKAFAPLIPEVQEHYDVTIGYGPGHASLFALDKVPNGGKKVLWVNTNLVRAGFDLKYYERVYQNADHIVAVCRNLLRDMQGYYPACRDKMSVFYDILDAQGIKSAAEAYHAAYPEKEENRILTVGRMCGAKALHLAVEAAALLKNKGIPFRWYIVGDGGLRESIESKILQLNVEDRVVLLGALDNPYPWFKDCDIYVQTSVVEGSCTTITEALIHGKPVVTTDVDIAFEKIDDGVNGLICAMTGEDIARKLERILTDINFRRKIEENIRGNAVFCGDKIESFYELVENLTQN